jgi:hypothetical protein
MYSRRSVLFAPGPGLMGGLFRGSVYTSVTVCSTDVLEKVSFSATSCSCEYELWLLGCCAPPELIHPSCISLDCTLASWLMSNGSCIAGRCACMRPSVVLHRRVSQVNASHTGLAMNCASVALWSCAAKNAFVCFNRKKSLPWASYLAGYFEVRSKAY